MRRDIFIALAWGVIATGISFWSNLVLGSQFDGLIWLSLSASVEEVSKLIGMRSSRLSLIIPIAFALGEMPVQMSSPIFGPPTLQLTLLGWIFSLVILKHTLYYAASYLLRFRLISLLVAVPLHVVWNIYATTEDEWALVVVTLAVIILPAWAMWTYQRRTAKDLRNCIEKGKENVDIKINKR